MSDSKNLRPYHNPDAFSGNYPAVYRPGVGVVDEHGATLASKVTRSSGFQRAQKTGSGVGIYGSGSRASGASARTIRDLVRDNYSAGVRKNVYADLELAEYFEWQNLWELIRSLARSFVENYFKMLVAQPFEVSRLLLQVGDFQTETGAMVQKEEAIHEIDDDDDDDDDEEVEYFQTKGESSQTLRKRTKRSKNSPVPAVTKTTTTATNKEFLKPVSLHTVDIMSSVLAQEGARGLWRATNTTFVYNALSATMEAWLTGLISPFLHIPDPFFVDVTHSPDPTTTLCLSLAASLATGLILAPLDLIRTRLVVTRIQDSERSLRNSIKNLKFLTCPMSLIIPTLLHTASNTIFKKLTPYILFVKFGIDSISSPVVYGCANVLVSIFELFVKLPLETLLRRAQVSYLLKPSSNQIKLQQGEHLVVKFAGYSGLHRTLYDVYNYKGENGGIEALFRGWRVGVLNIVGSVGLRVLRASQEDLVQREEQF